MSVERTNTNGGLSFLGLLTIVFITLKLTGFITWSWWLILAAFWIGPAIALTVVAVIMAVGLLGDARQARRRRVRQARRSKAELR